MDRAKHKQDNSPQGLQDVALEIITEILNYSELTYKEC